ncbi:MAG: ribonuclease P protein component [Candidatus Dadabacteria bacterium]
MAGRFGFGKAEKLKSRKQIEEIFLSGKNFGSYPLRVIYKVVPQENGVPVKVGVSVSKRYFKKAVHRNRIKRLMREAYRLQKEELVNSLREQQKGLVVFFIYNHKELPNFSTLKEAMAKSLDQLQKRSNEDEPGT